MSQVEETRSRLLQAAVASFAAKGFHGTTTRDIASSAGMSPGALYVHHRSKEELLYRISRDGHEHTLGIVRRGVASSADPAEQLRTVIREFARDHALAHTQARIVNYELAALSPEHAAEILQIRRGIGQALRRLVEAGVAAGRFRTSNPRMAAVAVLSLGIDIARWYRDDGEWTPEEIGDFYADLALRIVGATQAQ